MTPDWSALQAAHEFDVFGKRGITLVRGRGCSVWDDTGREYLDASGAYGVASVGHCHPGVVAAITRQAGTLINCPGSYANDVRAQLLDKLTAIAPGPDRRAFLCNSGTEAIEAALKFARFHTRKTGIIAAMRGFHGRSMGALSATFKREYKDDFGPLVPGFRHVPFGAADKLIAALDDDTAAVVLEPVQGEGGVHIPDPGYLATVAAACRPRGVLLIADEIQTGFGRTGRMFACEHDAVVPDLLCLAKGIAGGVPMGAVVCAGELEVPKGRHGTTFGGNPLACAAALATIEILESERLPARAAVAGAGFQAALTAADLPNVRAIRQIGLMIGVELKHKVQPVLEALLGRGILALPAGATVLRFLPPLTISDAELDHLAAQTIAALTDAHGSESRAGFGNDPV